MPRVLCERRRARRFSLSYGAGLGHERAYGGGDGLRVALLPRARRAMAWLGGVLVADEPLDATTRPMREALFHRAAAPFAVDVSRPATPSSGGESGGDGHLRVAYAGRPVIDAPLVGWEYLVRAEWRVGIAASTAHEGHFGDGAAQGHTAHDLRLTMGAAYRRAEVPFGVSYNAQDFFPPALPTVRHPDPASGVATADFMFGTPVVSSVSPPSGVIATDVLVRGDLMPFGRRLDRSGGYRCRFQQLIRSPHLASVATDGAAAAVWGSLFDLPRAQLGTTGGWALLPGGVDRSIDAELSDDDAADEHLSCEVPRGMSHGRYALEVSMHDAEWGNDGRHFLALEPRTEPLHATPDEAPATAHAVRALVTGVQLDGGFAYACRPAPSYPTADGTLAVGAPGTYVPAMRAVRCVLPPPAHSVAMPLAVSLQISLDGAQYNAGGAPFTFRHAPVISAYMPAGGPVGGGAVVQVYGSWIGRNTSAPVDCRFGATTVRARRAAPSALAQIADPPTPTLSASGGAASPPPPSPANSSGGDGTIAPPPPNGDSALSCVAPEARWAGLLFGSVDGRPVPDMSGVWLDIFGRELQVCTRDGGLVMSAASLQLSAAAVWDEQASAYVGMWQQWRPSAADPHAFPHAAADDADAASARHARGFFRWGVDYPAAAAAYVAAGAVPPSAPAPVAPPPPPSNGSDGGSGVGGVGGGGGGGGGDASGAPDLREVLFDLQLTPQFVHGAWSAHGAGRHFGEAASADAPRPNGEWNATRTSDLPPGASLCAWLLNVSEASGLATTNAAAVAATAAATSGTTTYSAPVPSAVPSSAPSAAAAAAAAAASPLAEAVHASEVANLAAALQAKPPWTALGTAQLRAGALGAGTPTSPSRPAPRQYITLTEPLKGERGAVVWDPAPMLAAHAACYERLSLRLVVYAGGGDGGDGLSVALGRFTSGELLHVLGSANGTLGGARAPRAAPTPRARGVGEGSIELWLRGERRWRASGAAAALPAGRWVAIHLVFAGAADAIHLMIDGVERLRNFPLDGGGPFEAPADGGGGGGGWRFGVAASSAAFVDRHAVAEARCSCGDGASVDLPFTTTTDGWNHVPAPPPPTAPPARAAASASAAAPPVALLRRADALPISAVARPHRGRQPRAATRRPPPPRRGA